MVHWVFIYQLRKNNYNFLAKLVFFCSFVFLQHISNVLLFMKLRLDFFSEVSSYLYLYSAFNNTNCVKETAQ